MKSEKPGPRKLNRRETMAAAGIGFAMLAKPAIAGTVPPPPGGGSGAIASLARENDPDGRYEIPGLHQGKGTTTLKFYPFDGASHPANFMVYDLPPGASEGVHTHFLDDHNKEGPYDEYYYIISGTGQMEIDGKIVPVAPGDHVHTPLSVAHGIENTHPTEHLRVFLTVIERKA